MKNIARKIVSLLLVAVLVLSLSLTAFAEGRKLYVCLGDSNASGYNTTGWTQNHVPAPKAYHSLVAEEMDMDLITYATGGYRTDEILYMIDPTFEMDWFYGDNLSHGHNHKYELDEYKDAYVEAIKKADVISIQVGLNEILGEDLGNAALVAFYSPIPAVEVIKARVAGKGILETVVNTLLDKVMIVFQVVTFIQDMSTRMKATNEQFKKNWDRIMELIYEMNPDVTIVALTMHNPMSNFSILPGSKIKTGKIFAPVLTKMNNYIMTGSKYADRYLACDISDVPAGDLALTQPDFNDAYLLQVHPTEEAHVEIANRIVAALEAAKK